jgi:hypothetical protein
MRRTLHLGLMVVLVFLCLPATSLARDSHAPPGAAPDWLPNEPWVMRHWLPYDEDALRAVLHLRDRAALQAIVSDTRTLSDAARAQHLDPKQVIDGLVAPWRGKVSPARYRLLRSRAEDTFTQPHLAVHMFFHPFHIDLLSREWPRLFGVSVAQTYAEMARDGLSYLQVAQRHRGARVPLVAEMDRLFQRIARQGVARREMLPAEGQRVVTWQSQAVGSWLQYRSRPTAKAAVASRVCHLG